MTLKSSDFKIGDKVKFIKEYERQDIYENPNYLPAIKVGTVGTVTKIKNEYICVEVYNAYTNKYGSIAVIYNIDISDVSNTEKMDCIEKIEDK